MICDTCKSARERVAIEDGRAEGEVTPWGEIIRPLPPMNPYDMDPHNVANYIRQAFLEAEGKDNADAYLAGRLLSWADMLDGMPFWVSSEAWLRERTTCLRERKVV